MPGVEPQHTFTAKSVTRLLKRHLDEPVRSGKRTLVLRREQDAQTEVFNYGVAVTYPEENADE